MNTPSPTAKAIDELSTAEMFDIRNIPARPRLSLSGHEIESSTQWSGEASKLAKMVRVAKRQPIKGD